MKNMVKIKIYKCKIFIFIIKFSEYSQHLGKHNRYIYYKFLIMSRFFYMIYFFTFLIIHTLLIKTYWISYFKVFPSYKAKVSLLFLFFILFLLNIALVVVFIACFIFLIKYIKIYYFLLKNY